MSPLLLHSGGRVALRRKLEVLFAVTFYIFAFSLLILPSSSFTPRCSRPWSLLALKDRERDAAATFRAGRGRRALLRGDRAGEGVDGLEGDGKEREKDRAADTKSPRKTKKKTMTEDTSAYPRQMAEGQRGDQERGREEICFCSFNAGLMDFRLMGVSFLSNPPFVEERVRRIPEALLSTNADVIALQEVFGSSHAHFLAESLKEAYPFCARVDEGQGRYGSRSRFGVPSLAMHNGLMVLSKFPVLLNNHREGGVGRSPRFHSFSHVTPLEALFASKGILEVTLEVPGVGMVALLNVHAASACPDPASPSAAAVRQAEMGEVFRVAQAAAERGEIPVVIGDLNAGPVVCRDNYSFLLERGFEDAVGLCPNFHVDKERQSGGGMQKEKSGVREGRLHTRGKEKERRVLTDAEKREEISLERRRSSQEDEEENFFMHPLAGILFGREGKQGKAKQKERETNHPLLSTLSCQHSSSQRKLQGGMTRILGSASTVAPSSSSSFSASPTLSSLNLPQSSRRESTAAASCSSSTSGRPTSTVLPASFPLHSSHKRHAHPFLDSLFSPKSFQNKENAKGTHSALRMLSREPNNPDSLTGHEERFQRETSMQRERRHPLLKDHALQTDLHYRDQKEEEEEDMSPLSPREEEEEHYPPFSSNSPPVVTWHPSNFLNKYGPHRHGEADQLDHLFLPPPVWGGSLSKNWAVSSARALFKSPCVQIEKRAKKGGLQGLFGTGGGYGNAYSRGATVTLSDHAALLVRLRRR
uniref:Endonuclease/exonuclease/phosphatase domain-containing protein n=1 Tax=Chromera velia CCMP2878 TaxID=1169474 RepID=A0A0G4FWW1_9ALVE|eukprot:Cvel_3817.t1-p1 / transcript=Cvel_3817.t1 / gene=Cvel_3817 / organism=Chromera_velia_CCMP2878 / gene_product=hypothetical protein / transcript_product=hypothetical protein / location=Cvel_scaffold161:35960-40045(-) / protein_length=757 / sequence_SO=supercontig / SO=protein_coding / is_pseudo=false